ncbi:MAG: TetR/AcrR family transcriptional regulator [Acidimicrobiales bacterium]|nr:TetR/AcrR family transcriptional regulator [Acidimicrobiales bacterium]
MGRPRQRTPELRDKILDVALDLLAVDGPAGVTTRAVASAAGTSAPAIYELFGDKSGLVRAVFFDGFRRLRDRFDELPPPQGTPADLLAVVDAFRDFTREHPRLFEVMYTKPFDIYAPTPEERSLGDATRSAFVDRAESAVQAGRLRGDPVDIAHAVLGLVVGLATQETAGFLGTTGEDCDRRWRGAAESLLRGYGVDSNE